LRTSARVLEGDDRGGSRAVGEALEAKQLFGATIAKLQLSVRALGALEDPLGTRDEAVIEAHHVRLERRLAQERPVLGDQVAAVGVVKQVGAEVRSLQEELRSSRASAIDEFVAGSVGRGR